MNNLFDTRRSQRRARTVLLHGWASQLRRQHCLQRLGQTRISEWQPPTFKSLSRLPPPHGRPSTTPTSDLAFTPSSAHYSTFLDRQASARNVFPAAEARSCFITWASSPNSSLTLRRFTTTPSPRRNTRSFGNFLEFHAESAYPEGWQNNQYANPDAIRIMTVHQAKGMQWPVVFVPALIKNRFPSKPQGAGASGTFFPPPPFRSRRAIEGTIEDERRLFYVAMTRSQKFLHLTYAPVPGKTNYFQRPSEFLNDVLRFEIREAKGARTTPLASVCHPTPRKGVANVVFSFSDLKYFFECPYQFKLRILYGFNAPIHEALGYGRSLHNALAEVHTRAFVATYADASRGAAPQRTPFAHALRLSGTPRET